MMLFYFLILYSVMTYGVSNVLVYGSGPFDLILKFRNFCKDHLSVLGKMLDCMMCTSLNVGLICSLFNVLLFPSLKFTPFSNIFVDISEYWYLIILFDAFFTSGVVWIIHSFQELCESVRNYLTDKNVNDYE